MTDGFRVRSIKIEGFKGFTVPKEIDLNGRHTFLLGQNGTGKSSVIEAIRWGLFGSVYHRQDDAIANTSYAGNCMVSVTLERDGTLWYLTRRLRRGTTRSYADIVDEAGQAHFIRDIIPQLDSLDAGEGTHIIFSSQSEPLRRVPADLNPFQRNVLNHLGLLRPQSLITHLKNFLTEHETFETKLGDTLNATRRRIDEDIADLERRRIGFLVSRPWGNGNVPTLSESENKVRSLILEIDGEAIEQSLHGMSLGALTDIAKKALGERRNQTLSQLQQDFNAIAAHKQRLEHLRDSLNKVDEKEATIRFAKAQIKAALDGISICELRKNVEDARKALSVADIKRSIVENATSMLDREQSERVVCPLCNVEHQRQDLQSTLRQNASVLSNAGDSIGLSQLEGRLARYEANQGVLQNLERDLGVLKQNRDDALKPIDADARKEIADHMTVERLNEIIDRRSTRANSIQKQIDGKQDELAGISDRLSKIEEERNYHQLQERLTRRNQSRRQFENLQESYQAFVDFGQSVQKIREAAEICFNDCLKEKIPGVELSLSQVFSALTRHPHYDKLVIKRDALPSLELLVASSQEIDGITHPTGVLNGQAESALELVPYFAFTQTADSTTEMYLLMLDDPTRAFDEEHTSILVELLAEIGQNVQIIVASQETTRFKGLLPKHFGSDSCVVIEPTNWSPQGGPTLNIDYQ